MPIKCQGWKGGENRSKLCSLKGRVSTLALILECEMYLGRDPFNQKSDRSDREKWST